MSAAFIYRPVTSANWHDLERLFEGRGGPHNCWCMVWRDMMEGADRGKKTDKKASLKHCVDAGTPVGLLCYAGDEPVAWCSIAPRETHRALGGDAALKDVWSLTCFFIRRDHRGRGITGRLIAAALDHARKNGASHVEAYPVDPGSPSYRFMGFRPIFERMGFRFSHRVGQRRNAMWIQVRVRR